MKENARAESKTKQKQNKTEMIIIIIIMIIMIIIDCSLWLADDSTAMEISLTGLDGGRRNMSS